MTNKVMEIDGALQARTDKKILEYRRDRFGFGEVPSCMYFYHIGVPTAAGLDPPVLRYYYTRVNDTIRYDELRELVRTLALNARKMSLLAQDPPPDGDSLNFNVWSRKSYIAFIIDDPNSHLDRNNPIELDPDNTGIINYSFFDGWSEEIDLSPTRNGSQLRSAVCFMNHMKRDANSDMGRSSIYMPFKLKIYPERPRLYPDSGGTNMGSPGRPAVIMAEAYSSLVRTVKTFL